MTRLTNRTPEMSVIRFQDSWSVYSDGYSKKSADDCAEYVQHHSCPEHYAGQLCKVLYEAASRHYGVVPCCKRNLHTPRTMDPLIATSICLVIKYGEASITALTKYELPVYAAAMPGEP